MGRGTHEPPVVEGHVHKRVLETVRGRALIETEHTVVPYAFTVQG